MRPAELCEAADAHLHRYSKEQIRTSLGGATLCNTNIRCDITGVSNESSAAPYPIAL